MKRILSIVLSLTTLPTIGQTAETGQQVNQNLRTYSSNYRQYPRTDSLYLNALKTSISNQPGSTTLSGDVTISDMNTVGKVTYNTFNEANSLNIAIDLVNGDDTKEPSDYTVQAGSFTGGVVFSTH